MLASVNMQSAAGRRRNMLCLWSPPATPLPLKPKGHGCPCAQTAVGSGRNSLTQHPHSCPCVCAGLTSMLSQLLSPCHPAPTHCPFVQGASEANGQLPQKPYKPMLAPVPLQDLAEPSLKLVTYYPPILSKRPCLPLCFYKTRLGLLLFTGNLYMLAHKHLFQSLCTSVPSSHSNLLLRPINFMFPELRTSFIGVSNYRILGGILIWTLKK